MTSNVVYKRQAKHLFTSFCESVIDNIKLNIKFSKYFGQIIWMQIKIKDQLLTRLSKVDVLINYWDKMLGQIQMKASKTKDKKATALCRQIILVPKEVQYTILKKYVSACRLLYAIAFTQWRLEYPSELRYEEDELNEILKQRIQNLYDLPKIALGNNNSTISKDFFTKYNLVSNQYPFMINSLAQIGWVDPFPNDSHSQKSPSKKCSHQYQTPKMSDMVYPKNKIVEGVTPQQVYIPNKEIMLKIMRSSIYMTSDDEVQQDYEREYKNQF